MAREREDNALLEALQSLYSQIVSLVLGQRMHRAANSTRAATPRDIGDSLSAYIEKVSREKRERPKPPPDESAQAQPAPKGPSPAPMPPVEIPEPPAQIPSDGLSRHFKATRTGSALHPHIGEQLKVRVWDHIHEAVRTAHDGDAKTAKLHVEIANSALKEAAQHMSDEDYQAFVAAVGDRINELVSPKKSA